MEYAEAVQAKAIIIHETYNPGAVTKVSVFDPDGKEIEAWSGVDPTPRTNGKGISVIPIKVKFKIRRIKIFIDSPSVPGWNEIDAVGIRESAAKTHWAVAARASSTFAQQVAPPRVVTSVLQKRRIDKLEADVKRLTKEVEKLRKLEADIAELKKLLKSRKNP